jgi:MFS family permease
MLRIGKSGSVSSVIQIPEWRRDLILLYFAMATTRVGFGVIIITFPSYLRGASDIQLGIALALYPLVEAVSAIPVGGFCDIRGRKIVFIAGLLSMSLLTASIGLTQDLFFVSGIHALMGLSAAAITVSSLTMITDLTNVSNRGKGMGTFDFANIVGYAIGLIFGGRLHDYFEYNLSDTFFITAAVLVMALIVSLVFLKEPFHTVKGMKMALNPFKVLDERTKVILPIWLSLTSLLGVVFFLPRAFRGLGIGATLTGDLLFLGIVVLGLGSIGFGALSDRLGRERTMTIGIIGLLGLLISLGLSVGEGNTGPRFFENMHILAPFGLASSALVPSILAAVGDRVNERFRGAAMGLYSLMLSLGIATGELLAGAIHSVGGLSAILYGGAAIFLVASIGSFVLMWRVKKKRTLSHS